MSMLRQIVNRFAGGAGGRRGPGAPRGGPAGRGGPKAGAGRGSTGARVGAMAEKFLRGRR
jgi:hypothetical protein